jgi:glutamyl-tRNA(Gln) amidotransferase subunit D
MKSVNKPSKKVAKETKKEHYLQKYQPGDKVLVKTEDKVYKGIMMPSDNPSTAVVKLDSGYNVGIDTKQIKAVEVLDKAKGQTSIIKSPASDPSKPTIAILHTGGTVASKVDYETGGVIASFTVADFLQMFPEMKNIANIRSNHISNMMSEDMRFIHYQKIAKAIQDEITAGVKGIIIGHGTDTLAITAAALTFMFDNLPVPVILVGSQRSSDRGSTDSEINLVCAAEFITKTDFAGVAICMHASTDDNKCLILPPTKTRKLHTSRRDAFKTVNDTPIAEVDYQTRKIQFLKHYPKKSDVKGKLILKNKFDEKVAIIKTYVNMSPLFYNALIKEKFKGLVLEGTGIGQIPSNIPENLPNYEALKDFIKQGGIVVLTSQCIFGRVHPDIYANCRRLKEIGVIFGEDMLTETAHIKLAWLLGNYTQEEAKQLIAKNIKGEITERTGTEFI